MKKLIVALENQGLPIPVKMCENCGGIIYRKDHWFQCPDCGALSTCYGGCYANLGPNGGYLEASEEWKELCQKSKEVRSSFQPDYHKGAIGMKIGNCKDCGAEISLPVKVGRHRERCETCARVRIISRAVEWRKRKALAGKCTVCGKRAPLAGRLLCESCSDRRNASIRRIQRQHRADGRCKCGATPQEGYKTCTKCLAVKKEYRTRNTKR